MYKAFVLYYMLEEILKISSFLKIKFDDGNFKGKILDF